MNKTIISEKIKRIFNTASHLLSYGGCICVALLIMYYLDGSTGVFLVSALVCALVLSLLLTLTSLKTLEVDIAADSTAAAKGENVSLTVRLNNKIILPVPIVEIEIDCPPSMDNGGVSIYKGTVTGHRENILKISLTALYSGLSVIRIKRVSVSDFLGIFLFDIKMPIDRLSFKVAVYPDIPDAVVQTEFLKSANRFANTDDEEEESNETSPIPTGMPGYDHREYVPGDPIKRINWKLSSKRDTYMIRLDEIVRGTGQMFFLDCPIVENTAETLKIRDTVIEGTLAMFSMMVREGRDAVFFYCKDGVWVSNEIHEQGDIFNLQEQLSDFVPCESSEIIPKDILNAGKTPICITAAVKGYEENAAAVATNCPDSLIISAQSAELSFLCAGHWTISEEFEFNKGADV